MIDRIENHEGCLKFAESMMAAEERKTLNKSMFSCLAHSIQKKTTKAGQVKIDESHWKCLNDMTFESFKNFESLKLRKDVGMVKSIIQRGNARNYILLRWVEHYVKGLQQIGDRVILSEQTREALHCLKKGESVLGLQSNVDSYICSLQKQIKYLEDMYHSTARLRTFNFGYWEQISKLFYLHLYSLPRKTDLVRAQPNCHILTDKEDKEDRGWLIEKVVLRTASSTLPRVASRSTIATITGR